MNVYTCTDHQGVWPVGVASVVVAPDIGAARELLYAELMKIGIDDYKFTLQLLDTSKPKATILLNGDY